MELSDLKVVAEGLSFPEGPVAISDGSVVVAEVRSGRITRCGPDGSTTLVSEVGGGPSPSTTDPPTNRSARDRRGGLK
jgi:gluconolactonase